MVQKHFYDAFLQDEDQVKFHLARIEELLTLRSNQWQRTVEASDLKSAELQDLAIELAKLRAIKEQEEREMEALEARLYRL